MNASCKLDLGWIFRPYLFGKSRGFPLNPEKVKLFAEASTATKQSTVQPKAERLSITLNQTQGMVSLLAT